MKKRENLVKVDSRNRITIPKKMGSELDQVYRIYQKNGKIILEPIREVHPREKWLFDPKNKHIVDQLHQAIERSRDPKNLIDLGDFSKYVKKKK
ncbi:hypothetical protein A3J41_02925 [candidate division TM6 bacterium RIFCSPHIGHO2_12_FULL_38_8]|nr:MAG: hypothetical protein A3J41_02925 [candidate division TM6 bacterium RIFCSPHIGHO2_12_FULL_38_8]